METVGGRRRAAWWLFLALVVVYNSNGREIGSYDTQPQKYTAREVAVKGTLRLTRVIDEHPPLAERVGFAQDLRGRYRSAYPILPGLLAAVPAAVFHWTGVVDMDAPLAPFLVAALTASLMTAAAVALIYLMLLRLVSSRVAMWTALGLGLGTGYWPVVSQSLWQHGAVALGLSLCLYAWIRPTASLDTRNLWLGGLGLAVAGAGRPATGLVVAVLMVWILRRVGVRRALVAAVPVAVLAAASIYGNIHWFGDPMGATWMVESVHAETHDVGGLFAERPWESAAGLLVSPSRGLLIFSPVILVALFGLRTTRRNDPDVDLRWLLGASLVQFTAYACYSVWWGGHTYGPRYLLDILPLLAPAAALGVSRLKASRFSSAMVLALLIWSVTVAGTGAFMYPNEVWNTTPRDVDRNHDRLWDVSDTQILRVMRAEPSPQNFQLFTREAFRRPPETSRGP